MFKAELSHKKYSRISIQKRSKLIQRVTEQRISVVKASKKLGIKISTAKLILKKFKETGGIFQKKMPDYKRKDLKEGQSEKPGEFASLEMNRNQNTSIEGKLHMEEGEVEACEASEPFVGIYMYWPVFYYQI